jgi:cellulose synthase/poly-beta-1,6-N-acetylglucosamine synthase-like glycosyltransferase
MSSTIIIMWVVSFAYIALAVWSVVTAWNLKISGWYKFWLIVFSIIFPPLGFVLTLWTRYRLKKNNSDKKDKPVRKKNNIDIPGFQLPSPPAN